MSTTVDAPATGARSTTTPSRYVDDDRPTAEILGDFCTELAAQNLDPDLVNDLVRHAGVRMLDYGSLVVRGARGGEQR